MNKIVVKQTKKPYRAHRMLFDDELPFKARREAPKTVYSRKIKHRKNLDN